MEVPPANIKFYIFLRPLTIITRELQRYCYIVLAVVSYGYILILQSLQTFDMKTIFRLENLKPKWRKNQEDALDKNAEDQQEIKDTTEKQNKINQDLMKNIRADGLLVPFNGTTVHDLENERIPLTLKIVKNYLNKLIPDGNRFDKNYLNKLIPDGNRFDNILKRAWTDKNDDIEQIFKKMIHILHSTGIAENEKCKLSTPIQGQDESVMNYSKRFEEYHKQLEGTDEFNRLIHADTISTRLYVLLLKGLNNSIKKHLPIPGLQKLRYEEVIEKLTEVDNTALIFGDSNHVNAINNSRQFNKKFFNKNNRQYKPRYNTNSSNHKETTSNGNTYEKKNKTNFNKRKPNTN
uniref:Retrotransposon gag domain-containing protein n=1 Tax=Strongyloides papillosus TaxID=174720 RepID=A0A0N5BZC7_STREA